MKSMQCLVDEDSSALLAVENHRPHEGFLLHPGVEFFFLASSGTLMHCNLDKVLALSPFSGRSTSHKSCIVRQLLRMSPCGTPGKAPLF